MAKLGDLWIGARVHYLPAGARNEDGTVREGRETWGIRGVVTYIRPGGFRLGKHGPEQADPDEVGMLPDSHVFVRWYCDPRYLELEPGQVRPGEERGR